MLWTMQGKVIFSPSALITGQNEDQSGVQEQDEEEKQETENVYETIPPYNIPANFPDVKVSELW